MLWRIAGTSAIACGRRGSGGRRMGKYCQTGYVGGGSCGRLAEAKSGLWSWWMVTPRALCILRYLSG